MHWHKLNRNRWDYREGECRSTVVVTLQDAKSVNKGWRFCRGWYDGVRQGEWTYLGPAVTTLEEAQAATIVLVRMEV